MTTLVTGANGFVGSALCARLCAGGLTVRAAMRSPQSLPGGIEVIGTGTLSGDTDWSAALKGVQHVVHLAARVHIMKDASADPLAAFRRVNVEGTAHLARQAAAAGVKRFVYLSSIKVNGESTPLDQPFTASDTPAPEDPYGQSKHEAEQALQHIAAASDMELVIIRPPLVYGPGVKANFASMLRWLSRGIALPLAAITDNRRSLVALDNLIDLISTCLHHRAAAGQVFLVSDGEDLSTAELLRRAGRALGRPARLFYVPPSVLHGASVLLGKRSLYQRLCNSLRVDIEHTQQLLNWRPPLSVDEGLRRAAQGWGA